MTRHWMSLKTGSLSMLFGAVLILATITNSAVVAPPQDSSATDAPAAQVGSGVPRLVSFSGVVKEVTGKPASGVVSLTLSLYSGQQGGTPLWSETQDVQVDDTGRYTVLIGATAPNGLPLDLFTTGTARWLGVQPGLSGVGEQPRVLLVGMPYALKAADADTLGGKPASAYVMADTQAPAPEQGIPNGAPATSAKAATPKKTLDSTQAGPLTVGGTGTTNFIPIWTNSTTLGNSALFQIGGKVGLGTMTPAGKLHVVDSSPSAVVRATQNNAVVVSSNPTFLQALTSIPWGVAGISTATANGAGGVAGFSSSKSGIGVIGWNGSTTGTNDYGAGVIGVTDYPRGNAVIGQANSSSGNTIGVHGISVSTAGTGVRADANAASGNTVGVSGNVNSPAGIGGVFINNAGGKALSVRAGAGVGEVFSVGGGSPNAVLTGNLTVTSRVGIGTTAPDNTLTVNGSADKPGGGSWGTFSDARLKTLQGGFHSGLAQVLKLNPIRYRYKEQNALGITDNEEHVGFVAQDVQKLIPEAVSADNQGYLIVNNDPILWAMLNAIKEQQAQIRNLSRVSAEKDAQIQSLTREVQDSQKVQRQMAALEARLARVELRDGSSQASVATQLVPPRNLGAGQ